MRVTALVALLFAAAVAAVPAAAEDWGPPTAEYTTLLTLTDGTGETLAHRLYYTAKRQRLDYKVGGRDEITIVDHEAGAVFVLYPALKRYRKSPLVQPEFDLGVSRVETKRERLAEETVAGSAATKYRVEAKTAQGQEFKGLAWITPERILVKFEGEVKHGRRTRRLSMIASELKTGPVDPALFQLPRHYTRIDEKK